MTPTQTTDEMDIFAEVRPVGWLAERLKNISNFRKWRWNQYLRACKSIPKSSPVYGSTSWRKINNRRLELCGKSGARNKAEFEALQDVCSARMAGPQTAELFILSRYSRLLKRKYSND